MMNESGKTLTIFLIIISVLLLSFTAIAVYLYKQENDMRNALVEDLEKFKVSEVTMQKENQDQKQKISILEEKLKESDEKINSLYDEIDLNKGIVEEIKTENKTLKGQLTNEQGISETLRKELENAKKQREELEEKLKAQTLSLENAAGTGMLSGMDATAAAVAVETVQSNPNLMGAVLNVNQENQFVIFDLGSINGIQDGMVMSVYRSDTYLGDIKVNRVQTTMSVADFLPPLTSKDVQANDQVLLKK